VKDNSRFLEIPLLSWRVLKIQAFKAALKISDRFRQFNQGGQTEKAEKSRHFSILKKTAKS